MIANAIIVDESNIDTSVISLGSHVKVYNVEYDEELEYDIVGSNEANPLLGKISDQSPVGRALLGFKAGAEITLETPGGLQHLKVLDVTRSKN